MRAKCFCPLPRQKCTRMFSRKSLLSGSFGTRSTSPLTERSTWSTSTSSSSPPAPHQPHRPCRRLCTRKLPTAGALLALAVPYLLPYRLGLLLHFVVRRWNMHASVRGQGSLIEASLQLHELEDRLHGERGQQRNRRVPKNRGIRRVRLPHSTTVAGDEGVPKSEAYRFRHLGEQSAVRCTRRKVSHLNTKGLDSRLDDFVEHLLCLLHVRQIRVRESRRKFTVLHAVRLWIARLS